jgi:hypothetical protein
VRRSLIVVATLALVFAGAAGAYELRTVWLSPGQCKKVSTTQVCARKVAPVTVTVAPSPVGQTFTGNGDQTLAPFTLQTGTVVHWTAQPDAFGYNTFSVSSSPSDTHYVNFDNGNNGTSGQSYLPPGTYTLNITATAQWTLSF